MTEWHIQHVELVQPMYDSYEYGPNNTLKLTINCFVCGTPNVVVVNEFAYENYMDGTAGHIQDALPELTAAERELLMNKMCNACFKAGTAEPEEAAEDS